MILYLEILFVWIKYILVMLVNGIMSLLSIILFPISYFFRYKTPWDIFFFLLSNDVDDGDIGAEWWLEKNNLKPGFWTSWKWTIRNSAWWFKNVVFVPKWDAEKYKIVLIVANTIDHPMRWVSQSMRGINHCYYRVEGRLYFRFSFTNNLINMYFGMGSKRYVFKCRRSYPKN
jgi:hypothetical protein